MFSVLTNVLKCCGGSLSSCCSVLLGRRDVCPRSGEMLCWSLCQRKEPCPAVIQ